MTIKDKEERNYYYRNYYQKNKERYLGYIKKYHNSEKGKIREKEYLKEYMKRPEVVRRNKERWKIRESTPLRKIYRLNYMRKRRKDIKFRRKEYLYRRNKKDSNKNILEKERELNRNYYQKNKIKKRVYKLKWKYKNMNKVKSEKLAQRLIKIPKGKLCEICNINKAVHRHHEDYSQPLHVMFLCSTCHGKQHRKI